VFALLLALVMQQAAPLPGVFTPVEGSVDEAILGRFDALPAEEQERIALEAIAHARQLDHPLAARAREVLADPKVAAFERHAREAAPLWDAKLYAPALKLKHTPLTAKDRRWKSLERQVFGRGERLTDHARYAWDDGRQALILPQDPPPREVVLALLNGRMDPLGEVAAAVEGLLDDRAKAASAFYFDHVYRDRDGRSYVGITLGDIWGSQVEFGISDADAIAWMRTVADDRSLTSPIATRDQRPLYRRIEADYVLVRDARNLRRALAARFIDPLGEPPALLGGILEQIDRAWLQQDNRVEGVAALIRKYPERGVFFAAVRQLHTVREGAVDAELAASRMDLPMQVREATLDFLAEEGLLGFRRR
jgi:hypothetical protein